MAIPPEPRNRSPTPHLLQCHIQWHLGMFCRKRCRFNHGITKTRKHSNKNIQKLENCEVQKGLYMVLWVENCLGASIWFSIGFVILSKHDGHHRNLPFQQDSSVDDMRDPWDPSKQHQLVIWEHTQQTKDTVCCVWNDPKYPK